MIPIGLTLSLAMTIMMVRILAIKISRTPSLINKNGISLSTRDMLKEIKMWTDCISQQGTKVTDL